jgi:hypothetical protein
MTTPLQMLVMMFAGWLNEHQRTIIAYLQEENRVLRELHGKKRLRFNNDQRRRLAVKGKTLGRRVLREVGTLVTPDTVLRWHRELIARKHDGSESRRPGRLERDTFEGPWPNTWSTTMASGATRDSTTD